MAHAKRSCQPGKSKSGVALPRILIPTLAKSARVGQPQIEIPPGKKVGHPPGMTATPSSNLRRASLLGRAELRAGRPAAARARLDRLESDARGKGFLLIARQASASLPGAH